MSSISGQSYFESESSWPFRLHHDEMADCLDFIDGPEPAPRVVRVFGRSGTGKSFLAREVLVRASTDDKNGLGVYLDVPPGGLEASAFFEKLESLLARPSGADRERPTFVGRRVARAWNASKRGRASRKRTYVYGVGRDLIAQIPVVGPFIKALLPSEAFAGQTARDGAAALRFLVRRSHSQRVDLVLDNTQFLPFAVRESLASEFAEAGPHLRLILIERVRDGPRVDWSPEIPLARLLDVRLAAASQEEVSVLVREILPDSDYSEDVATAVFRRSGGNLKAVWFQLRLIASRHETQQPLPAPSPTTVPIDSTGAATYEDVIQTLPALDQTVLRSVVFTVGGLTIATLASLLEMSDLGLRGDAVSEAVADLTLLGLLVVNGDRSNRVRVEHELVAQTVADTTPEEEKLDLHNQIVSALSALLDAGATPSEEAVLYDRLIGIVGETELRQTPSLLARLVEFIHDQSNLERHRYLVGICRDTACWDVLDTLPETTLRSLLDAVQKSSVFEFGLVATAKLRRAGDIHDSLASLYEAKYLVQLFRYREAQQALRRVTESKEKRVVDFNVMLSLAQDEDAAEIATAVFHELSEDSGDEYDYVVLRNSSHLFSPDDSRKMLRASLDGFERLGKRFGVASALNNLGIIDLVAGSTGESRANFDRALRLFRRLESVEVYQPLMNLSAVALLEGDIANARSLLERSRESVPRALRLDSAMLDHNEVALELCETKAASSDTVMRVRSIVDAARRTQDVRFTDVTTWFADSVEAVVAGRSAPGGPSSARVEQIRAGGQVALELFIPVSFEDRNLDVPFVLSPHWRY